MLLVYLLFNLSLRFYFNINKTNIFTGSTYSSRTITLYAK